MLEKEMELHNQYGLLFTVLGVLLITEFSPGRYDYWDAFLAVLAGLFAISFFRKVPSRDLFSTFLAGAILSSALLSICDFFGSFPLAEQNEDREYETQSTRVAIVVVVSSLIAAFFGRKNS